jgi:hypothetical protein
MKLINRRKSRTAQAADLVAGAAKTARKAIKATVAYKAAKGLAKRTPVVRRAPIVLAAGGATVVAAKKLRSSGTAQPEQSTPPPPTSATVPG